MDPHHPETDITVLRGNQSDRVRPCSREELNNSPAVGAVAQSSALSTSIGTFTAARSVVVISAEIEPRFTSHLRGAQLVVTVSPALPSPRDLASIDLVLFDIRTTRQDSVSAVRAIRSAAPRIGLVLIGDFDRDGDPSHLLDAGADDVLTTPICPAESLARIRALLRRIRPHVMPSHGPVLGSAESPVTINDAPANLTKTEIGLLSLLLRNRDRVVSRSRLLQEIWGLPTEARSNVLSMCICSLRRKLEVPGTLQITIHTIHGVGFRLQDDR